LQRPFNAPFRRQIQSILSNVDRYREFESPLLRHLVCPKPLVGSELVILAENGRISGCRLLLRISVGQERAGSPSEDNEFSSAPLGSGFVGRTVRSNPVSPPARFGSRTSQAPRAQNPADFVHVFVWENLVGGSSCSR